MSEILPESIINLIMSYIPNPWKLRFSNDVLPHIDQGWKWVGITKEGGYCTDCYKYGFDIPCFCIKTDPVLIAYSDLDIRHWDRTSFMAMNEELLDELDRFLSPGLSPKRMIYAIIREKDRLRSCWEDAEGHWPGIYM